MTRWAGMVALAACFAAGCASRDAAAPGVGARELLPGIWVDLERREVSFGAVVAVDAFNEVTPEVYLETVICSPDTREHESLMVSDVTPSSLHAALLAVGVVPSWGDDAGAVAVTVEPEGGAASSPLAWVASIADGAPYPASAFVFRGSRIVTRRGAERYDADGTGVVIGLARFPSAVIEPAATFSPEAAVTAPVWIADRRTIPPRGTEVTVTIRAPGDGAGR